MKRRSLLGLIAAALCPAPPPGLPKVVKPGPRAVAFRGKSDYQLQWELQAVWAGRSKVEYTTSTSIRAKA